MVVRWKGPGCSRALADGHRPTSSYLALHLEGHLAELDINPLMVLPLGQGVKAVDALVLLRGT